LKRDSHESFTFFQVVILGRLNSLFLCTLQQAILMELALSCSAGICLSRNGGRSNRQKAATALAAKGQSAATREIKNNGNRVYYK
jgi:hypothetical protein